MPAALTVSLLLAAAPPEIVAQRDLPVRMRDGVTLRADVVRPLDGGRFPVLLYRTPYDKSLVSQDAAGIARAAVTRGYAVVVQDVRGRYASEGEFVPYRHEGPDGYDTIEWAASQPWSNGRVGTFGLSYPGAVQWLAALETPPSLVAMVPAMTFSSPRHFFYAGGVFDLSWIPWIWNNIAPDTRERNGLSGPRTTAAAQEAWRGVRSGFQRLLPLTALDAFAKAAPYYFEWLRHPPGDTWWDWAEVRGKHHRARAAVLNLSGWHDEAYGPEGAITNYVGLVNTRGGRDPRPRLVIGPWTHGVEATRLTKAGDREFGPQARIGYEDLVLRFMDAHVRGLAGWSEREEPVRVFVMGENVWRTSDTWPLAATRSVSAYLEGATTPGGAGRLWNAPPSEGPALSALESDPLQPVVDPFADSPGAHDYRDLPKRGDVLSFETGPLESDMRVAGEIAAEVFLESDAPDTDLWVKLFDVAPDGTAWNLMSPGADVLRASYRDGGPTRSLLVPGQVYKLRLENLRTANLFRKGHRLRVVLSTTFFPHFSRNLHTGELETVSGDARKATLRIYHDGPRPSRIILPVVD